MLSPRVVTVVLVLASAACTRADGPTKDPATTTATVASVASPPAAAPPPPPAVDPKEIDPRFVDDLKKAFAEYKAWGRVDDELRWAPWLCRMPNPGFARMSAADDGAHSKKLYSLFAREHAAYVSLGSEKPIAAKQSQIVVKESYVPELVPNPTAAESPTAPLIGGKHGGLGEGDHFQPYARTEDGKTYRASKLAGVYVVLEKDKSTPGTDDGFVYGTLTPTGEVTSAGRVASCMGCHVQAKHRRFFGAPGGHY
jgi:hypothetical protein